MGVRSNLLILCCLVTGCASHQIARNVKLISFTGEPKAKEVSIGNMEGRSCQWQVLSWPIGAEPTVKQAFANAVNQQDGGQLPMIAQAQANGGKLSVIRNVSTDDSFLNLYFLHRRCINVSGLGSL